MKFVWKPIQDIRVVTQGTIIFKLYTGINQALLVWGDSLFVLDLGLDILDGVRSFHFNIDGPACEGNDSNYRHTTII